VVEGSDAKSRYKNRYNWYNNERSETAFPQAQISKSKRKYVRYVYAIETAGILEMKEQRDVAEKS
jgi:hypothetical protein